MIVICDACHTRFRVADERIGPAGARLRCARCKALFVVKPAVAANGSDVVLPPPPPPTPVPAPLPESMPSLDGDPFAPRPTAAVGPVPTSHDTLGGGSTWDPFGVTDPPPPAPAPHGGAELELTPAPHTVQPAPDLDRSFAPLALEEEEPSPPPATFELQALAPPPAAEPADPFALAPGNAPAWRPPTPVAPPAEDATRPAPATAAGLLPDPILPPRPALAPAPDAAKGRRAQLAGVLSLVLLLAAAAAFSLAWRGRTHPAVRGPAALEAVHVRGGVYEAAGGREVVVVQGEVDAHQPVVGPVRVRVDLLNGEQIVATSTTMAGAVATPEQVYGASTPEAQTILEKELARKAATRLEPGARAPFLALFREARDVRGLTLRVTLEVPPPRR